MSIMQGVVIIVGMLCLTVVGLALIGASMGDEEDDDWDETEGD